MQLVIAGHPMLAARRLVAVERIDAVDQIIAAAANGKLPCIDHVIASAAPGFAPAAQQVVSAAAVEAVIAAPALDLVVPGVAVEAINAVASLQIVVAASASDHPAVFVRRDQLIVSRRPNQPRHRHPSPESVRAGCARKWRRQVQKLTVRRKAA